ncbi:MAG: hypothetical protein C0392_01045 [Syntrophus sp. (in: bacteria)]|nr:hypothetical protein [Syntrophus sp. (in: bacteria)]
MCTQDEKLCRQALKDLLEDYGIRGAPEEIDSQLQILGIKIMETTDSRPGLLIFQKSTPIAIIELKINKDGRVIVEVSKLEAPWT